MANFTTRVVLHKDDKTYEPLDSETYEILHEAMEEQGFSRTIIGDNGHEYHLPPAEYNKIGDFTGDQVRSSAQAAAKKTGKKKSIIVTEGVRFWIGLKKVKK